MIAQNVALMGHYMRTMMIMRSHWMLDGCAYPVIQSGTGNTVRPKTRSKTMKQWLRKHIQGGMSDEEYEEWINDLIAVVAGFAALAGMFWAMTL